MLIVSNYSVIYIYLYALNTRVTLTPGNNIYIPSHQLYSYNHYNHGVT